MRTIALAPLSLLSLLAPLLAHATDGTRIAVISDVHVDVHARVSPNFTKLVANLIQRRPKLVIFTGDATCGNEGDTYPLARIRTWWKSFAQAVAPLQAAGIPVLPIAGNHDYYLVAQQQAYDEGARAILAANPGKLELAGQVPLFYSLDMDGAHLILLHVVDQKLDLSVRKWLTADLAHKHDGKLLFAFGHVPLHSNMGHTDRDFEKDLGGILAGAGVSAYVAGHEHLYWDEDLALAPHPLRQVTVGTASATYAFELSPPTFAAACANGTCHAPASGAEIALKPDTRYERDAVSFVELCLGGSGGFTAEPFTLGADGKISSMSRTPLSSACNP